MSFSLDQYDFKNLTEGSLLLWFKNYSGGGGGGGRESKSDKIGRLQPNMLLYLCDCFSVVREFGLLDHIKKWLGSV